MLCGDLNMDINSIFQSDALPSCNIGYMHRYVFGKHPCHDPKMPLGRGLLGPELAKCSMEASFSSHA